MEFGQDVSTVPNGMGMLRGPSDWHVQNPYEFCDVRNAIRIHTYVCMHFDSSMGKLQVKYYLSIDHDGHDH